MKKVIIIGGGLSGLSAGVYALKAGFDVTIIEKNNEIGGLCTTWYKDGCMVDGCIHWLTGSSRGAMLPLYEDLGLLKDVEIYKPPYFYKFYYKNITIEISRDINVFKEQLTKYALEEDMPKLTFFFKILKKFRNVPFHSGKPIKCMKKTEVLGYVKDIAVIALAWNKTINMSLFDFACQFKSEILRHFFLSFMPSYYSLTYFAGVVSQFTSDNADTVYVKSKDLALNIKDTFLGLGGVIINNTEITKINFKHNEIESVESKNGKYVADYYINASPLPYFYNNLLPKKFHDNYIDYIFTDTHNYPLISTVYITMKIDKEYTGDINHFSLIYDDEGVTVGSSHNETLHYRAYPYLKNNDGSTSITCLIDLHIDDYDVFKKAKEKGTYEKLKETLAKKVMNIYIKRFPDVAPYIKVVDVATPLTFERATYTYKGAYLSNLATPFGERKTFDIKDKFVDNLYHAGQWITQIGGFPRALANGKFAVDELVYNYEIEERRKRKTLKRMKKIDFEVA